LQLRGRIKPTTAAEVSSSAAVFIFPKRGAAAVFIFPKRGAAAVFIFPKRGAAAVFIFPKRGGAGGLSARRLRRRGRG